jgi:hypothetical protein
MFDEPEDLPADQPTDPAQRAKEKSDYFRVHAELAAVFEGGRKFDAELRFGLDAGVAREIQRSIAKLERSRSPEHPILPPESAEEAAKTLNFHATAGLSTNDYHIHRRPGELMIVRWLEGEQVEAYYQRLQAHVDAALGAYREEERAANEWKSDPDTMAYLKALDELEVNMQERYLRPYIRQHKLFVLSTQTADQLDILYLTEHIMGVSAEELVGAASAPPDNPTDEDRAWFFKMFALRGMRGDVEQMCFFTYLQKTDDSFDFD